MDYVNLDKTGLKDYGICLGRMSYGAPARGVQGLGAMVGR